MGTSLFVHELEMNISHIFPHLGMMWLLSGASVSKNGLSIDGVLEHVEIIFKHDSIENIEATELAMKELGYGT